MARFRLTVRAEADLLEIADYTVRTWGEAQCDRYLEQLEQCCQRLADQPIMGRACDAIRAGLRRREQGKHVIFYRRAGRTSWSYESCTSACCPSCTSTKSESPTTCILVPPAESALRR